MTQPDPNSLEECPFCHKLYSSASEQWNRVAQSCFTCLNTGLATTCPCCEEIRPLLADSRCEFCQECETLPGEYDA